jgi:hypothetical protein
MKKTPKRELTKPNDENAPTQEQHELTRRATTRMSSRERVHEEKLTGMRSRG